MSGYPDNNPKTVLGIKKVPLHLVPPVAKIALAEAFADGATKYGPYNWRDNAVSASIYYAAAMRHMDAWWDGEENSKDANVPHLAHAMACLAIVLDAMSIGQLNDDRPKKGAAAAWQDRYAEEKTKEQHDATPEQPDLFISSATITGRSNTLVNRGLPYVQADVRTSLTDRPYGRVARDSSTDFTG